MAVQREKEEEIAGVTGQAQYHGTAPVDKVGGAVVVHAQLALTKTTTTEHQPGHFKKGQQLRDLADKKQPYHRYHQSRQTFLHATGQLTRCVG